MARLSFTKPAKRGFLDLESKILIGFAAVISLIIIAFSIFLSVQALSKSSSAQTMREEIKTMREEIKSYSNEIEQIKKLSSKADEVHTTNQLLQESIRNLFDLIPDQITLNRSVMEKDKLILYGVTPSKEVYNFILLSPLKSIFHENKTTFYSLENGWYRFVSVNVLHEGEVLAR
ncbi:MAG: hypothetical protein ACQERK_02635 [Campylobacterota bacterium]